MPRPANRSAQTRLVLAALLADSTEWRHGYEVAKQTGLKSGTLYPILARLAEQGLLESCWEDPAPEGRPRRHLYRLTSGGAALAASSSVAAVRPGRAAVPTTTIGATAWSG
jgi:DNA-binding PadR family transcriptional regulator